MQNLPNQFNVYDVLSYLIPGFIAVCLALLFLNNIFEILNILNSAFCIFAIIPISFVVGVIFHEFSNIFERFITTRPSEKILLKDCHLLTDEEKEFSCREAKDFFQLKFKNITYKDSHSIYCLFRSALKEYSNKPEFIEAELFNIYYGLARNLFAIFLFYTILFFIFSFDENFGKIYIMLSLILFIFTLFMYRRVNRFAEYHVVAIFRAYLQSKRFLSNQ